MNWECMLVRPVRCINKYVISNENTPFYIPLLFLAGCGSNKEVYWADDVMIYRREIWRKGNPNDVFNFSRRNSTREEELVGS